LKSFKCWKTTAKKKGKQIGTASSVQKKKKLELQVGGEAVYVRTTA
jgi:hypothetical protein